MKYLIFVDVHIVEGTQCFEVEAKNEKEAKDKLMSGEGDFVSEELEVKELDWNSMEVIDKN